MGYKQGVFSVTIKNKSMDDLVIYGKKQFLNKVYCNNYHLLMLIEFL